MRTQFRVVIALLVLATALATASVAKAEILVFDSQSAFFGAVTITSTENFDKLPGNTNIGLGSVTLGGVTYTADNPAAFWRVSAALITSSPPNSLTDLPPVPQPSTPATLTFETLTDAIGFSLQRGLQPALFEVIVTSASGELLVDMVGFGPGSPAGPAYRGYFSADGVASVRIVTQTLMGQTSNYFLDDVSLGRSVNAIPEPSSAILLGVGIAVALGFGTLRRHPSPLRRITAQRADGALE